MEYDPVTDTLIGFNSNGGIVQVNTTTGGNKKKKKEEGKKRESNLTLIFFFLFFLLLLLQLDSQLRIAQVPNIVASYSTVIDPVNRKYYASMIDGEKMQWLTVDISSWTFTSVLLKPALDYAHTVLIPQ
jgi:hypothetical protein